MSCGKKRLVKNWDHPRDIRIIKPSRYQQNEASVKVHWRKVVRDLELSYKDDQFWESQCDTVRELLGPQIFRRVAKIFNLPLEAAGYMPKSETSSLVSSERFYTGSRMAVETDKGRSYYSMTNVEEEEVDEEEEEEEESSESWSESSMSLDAKKSVHSKIMGKSRSKVAMSKTLQARSFSRYFSTTIMTQPSKTGSIRSRESTQSAAETNDDLEVRLSVDHKHGRSLRSRKNPYYEMLYCNESETDMIKWKSKYKVKLFEISASDEMSKKAEIVTKQISKEFYDWWVGLGNLEFKSEIKRPEDIESLFQVWFDEHASRGLMLHPKILPCVLESIANYVGAPEAACPKVLKRQIAWDVDAETTPAHVLAFGTCLPHKMKHVPPNNNTKEMWDSVKIPQDLRTMSCVWEDISHLTSTKAFQKWLEKRPHLPMPQCLQADAAADDKKVPFLIPSDYVIKDKDAPSITQELALPVSQFSLQLKEVLSKLMNQ